MDLEVKTVTTSGTRINVFKNTHGFDTMEGIAIDIADIDAADYSDGYIPAGFPLGKITASGKYAEYKDGNSDGTEVLVGLLFRDVPVTATTTTVSVPMIRHCMVVESLLPVAIDANGKADVAGHIQFI